MTYRSQADLGGQPVGEPIGRVAGEAVFASRWEARVFALTLAMGATRAWNLDTSRSVRETLPDYRTLGYYAIWLAALERLLVANGLASVQEIATGRAAGSGPPALPVLSAARVAQVLARGAPTGRTPSAPARFAPGERVRASATVAAHHTRLPGYVRGRIGTIERVHGVHVFPDTHAHGLGEAPQWLYTVGYALTDLWPDAPAGNDAVSVDAFESYLEPA